MPKVRVLYSSAQVKVREVRRRGEDPVRPSVSLIGESGKRLTLPLAPSEMDLSGLARTYEQLDRVGQRPVLERGELGLRVYTFSLTLVRRDPFTRAIDPERPVTNQIKVLQRFARTGERLRWVNFGAIETGSFRMTDLSITPLRRNSSTRQISVATANVELTEAVDISLKVGPASGGASTPTKKTLSVSGSGGLSRTVSTYTVKKGDTLSSIALKKLGAAKRYPEIADLNKIKDPNKITVGQVLKIPGE